MSQKNSAGQLSVRDRLVPRLLPLAQGGLIVLLVFFAYLPALRGGFVWDDDSWTTNISGLLSDSSGLWAIWFQPTALQQYYPLTGTTFWLDHQLWNLWTTPYHIENVLLHSLAVLFFWRLLLRLRLPGAWLAAALFALHPVMVESVAWITERKNVLSLALFLGALLAYERYAPWVPPTDDPPRPPDPARDTRRAAFFYGLAFTLFLGALLAKTAVFSLPAVVLLLGWWKRGQIRWRQDVVPMLPFFALAIGLCAVTAWLEKNHVGAQGSDFLLTFPQRCLVAGRAFWFYLGHFFWPANLIFVYPRWQPNPAVWWQWLYPAAAVAILLAVWLARKRIGRGPATALFYYVGTLFPVLGFMNAYGMRYSYVWDHWVYLSALGIAALVAALVAQAAAAWHRPAVICAFAAIVLPGCAILSWREAGLFADMETLWRRTLAKNPGSWMVQDNLGEFLFSKGRIDEAIRQFQEALRLDPDNALVHNNLSVAFRNKGQVDEAIRQSQEAIRLQPDLAIAHYNLGVDLEKKGQADEAIRQCQEAMRLDPNNALFHKDLGVALGNKGQIEQVIRQCQEVIRLEPDDAGAHNDLGVALDQQGRMDEAIDQFREAIRLKPDDVGAHNNLSVDLRKAGLVDEAISQAREALRLKPDDADAHNNLGCALTSIGQSGDAIGEFQAAIRLQPDDVDARNNLGVALARKGRLDEAISLFREILRVKPDDPEAQKNLARAQEIKNAPAGK